MLTYNPVVKKGLFEVSDGTTTKSYTAVNEAEAMFKFGRRFGVSDRGKLTVKTIRPTIRQSEKAAYLEGIKEGLKMALKDQRKKTTAC